MSRVGSECNARNIGKFQDEKLLKMATSMAGE